MAAISSNMSGWLDKRGGQDGNKGWKKRWCTLNENMFKYYKNDSDNTAAGIIYCEDIDEVGIDTQEAQKDITKHGFTFKIITKGRTYIFNAATNAKREEWKKSIEDLISSHKEDVKTPKVLYTTIEIFHGPKPAVRVNGNISTELMIQLSGSTSSKIIHDDRGWFAELCTTHATMLNLFNQHGWSLMTAFACSSIPSNSTTAAHSDMMVLTKQNPQL